MKPTSGKTSQAERAARIRMFILSEVKDTPKNLALHVARELGVTIKEVYAQIRCMVSEGLLSAEGRTSGRRYKITASGEDCRDDVGETPPGTTRNDKSDTELLKREPRTVQEAERKAWLMRKKRF